MEKLLHEIYSQTNGNITPYTKTNISFDIQKFYALKIVVTNFFFVT